MTTTEYLTADQVAAMLQIGVSQVYYLARLRGPDCLPSVRIGRIVRFPANDVDRYIAEHTRGMQQAS